MFSLFDADIIIRRSHDGKDITAGGRYKFLHDVEEESMSLVIKNVEASDAGDYKITASNELGEDHDTVHLMVKGILRYGCGIKYVDIQL